MATPALVISHGVMLSRAMAKGGYRDLFFDVIRAIPRGRVMTYGQVAELAGVPRGHRLVAAALRGCPQDVPWYRVLAKDGPRRARIAIMDEEDAGRQRSLLEAEGVGFDDAGRIVLTQFGWLEL